MNQKLFFVLLCLTLFLNRASAETVVQGIVSGTWGIDNSPYIVDDHITIEKNTSLEIAPGVQILFNGQYKLIVHGTLTATGTEQDSIRFSVNHPDSTWQGIRFLDADNSGILSYCIIEHAAAEGDSLEGLGGGVLCANSDITVEHSTIRYNSSISYELGYSGGAIGCIDASPLIYYNTITYNEGWGGGAGGGICCINSSPVIRYNHIHHNTCSSPDYPYTPVGGAIYCIRSNAKIYNNIIARNKSYEAAGIVFYWGTLEIINNTLVYNTATGSSPSTIGGNHAGPNIIKNNIIYFNKPDYMQAGYGTEYNNSQDVNFEDQGNINMNPLFVDSENDNFHLLPGSPCIDAGDPASDYSNEPHYNGNRINMGAYGNTPEATVSSPGIYTIRSNLNFGEIPLLKPDTLSLWIYNKGTSRLNIDSLYLDSPDGFTTDVRERCSLLPEDSLEVTLYINPVKTKTYHGTLFIKSNDPDQPLKQVWLSAASVMKGECFGELTAENSPFQVSGELIVPANKTLSLHAGCTLDFTGEFKLVANSGSIRAIGTPENPVTIQGQYSNMDHIEIFNSSNNKFEYCNFNRLNALNQNDGTVEEEEKGGAFYIKNSNVTFIKCTFNQCKAQLCDGVYGNNSSISISNCTFSNLNNLCFGEGAISVINNCNLNVCDSRFTNNFTYENGACITSRNCYLEITGNIFTENKSMYNAPVAAIWNSTGMLGKNVFHKNGVTDGHGCGAVYINESEIKLAYNQFTSNLSPVMSPALNIISSTVQLYNNTFADNYYKTVPNWPTTQGGAVYSDNSNITMINNIFWNNQAVTGLDIYAENQSVIGLSFSNVNSKAEHIYADNTSNINLEDGLIYADPLFAGVDSIEYHLTAYSPCIDKGSVLNYPYSDSAPDMGCYEFSSATKIEHDEKQIPDDFLAAQNYPNPFNPVTTLSFSLPVSGHISLRIYDIQGRLVDTLLNNHLDAGYHNLKWNAMDNSEMAVAAGIYFYQIRFKDECVTKKMVLTR